MLSAAVPPHNDAARLFSIPAAFCAFVALASCVLNGYVLRPAEAAKTDAGRLFVLAQGLSDTFDVLIVARAGGNAGEIDSAANRLLRLRNSLHGLASTDPLVEGPLRHVQRDLLVPGAQADERIRRQGAIAQRAVVRRGQNMLAIAQRQSDAGAHIFDLVVVLAMIVALAGLRWGSVLFLVPGGVRPLARPGRAAAPTFCAIDSLGRTLMNASSESICVTDRDGVIREVNGGYLRATGYTSDEVIGQDLDFNLAPRPGEAVGDARAAALVERSTWNGELWRRHKSGEAFLEHTSRALLYDAEGDIAGVVSIARDLGASRDAQRLLSWQASHDQLTKLPNRARFLDRLGSIAVDATEPGAVLILDIDRFKEVNDSYGYAAGDQLLTQFAHRLALGVRDRDTVARLSGDRFGLLLAPPLAPADVERVAQSLLTRLAEPITVGSSALVFGASIGISVFPGQGANVATLVRQAEHALAEAKQTGRNGYRFFDAELTAAALRRAQLEQALGSAVAQQQLHLVYQPIVDVKLQRVYAVEALLRWHHPTLGHVSPAEFIPIAEQSGLMGPIGLWVCDAVVLQMDQWRREGLGDLRVSVNISGRQLRTKEGRDEIARRVSGRHAQRLTLEITESLLLDDADGTGEFLRQVRAAGVQVALDDFGTGYSSLSYLLRFPIDVLKIDKSFIDLMESDNKALQLVATIVSMGRILGLLVVAEGVETEGQVQKLALCGGELIQGYFFARPMAAGDVAQFAGAAAGQMRLRMAG